MKSLSDVNPLILKENAPGLGKGFDHERRVALRDKAVLFSSALHGKFLWSDPEKAELISSWCEGAMDTPMAHQPSSPGTWPVVRSLLRKRREEEEAREQEKSLQDLKDKQEAARAAWAEANTVYNEAEAYDEAALKASHQAALLQVDLWRTGFVSLYAWHCMALYGCIMLYHAVST